MAAWLYKVITGLVFQNGLPVIDGAERTTKEGDTGHYIAYRNVGSGKRSETLAVVWQDPSGACLVGCEATTMNKLPAPRRDLQAYIASDPSKWQTWLCSGQVKNGTTVDYSGATMKTAAMKTTVSEALPVEIVAGSKVFAVGAKATIGSSIGPLSKADVEKDTTWIGDRKPSGVAAVKGAEPIK